MQTLRVLVTIVLCSVVGACAVPPASRCRAGEQRLVADTLYFGTREPDGSVTDDEWDEFLATVVTPRFPQGLTVSRASGQWRGAEGAIVRESTYVLHLVHADDAADEKSVTEIMAAYRSRFRQEAVFRVRDDACGSF